MRILICLLLFILVAKPVFTQVDKQEMQKQMGKAVNVLDQKIAELEKQIDEAIKNNESATDIQLKKNALKTMKETRNSLSGSTKQYVNSTPPPMAENIEQQQNDDLVIPKRDETRISSLTKKTLTEAELIPFIKNVNTGVANLIPAAEKTEALNIYNETKAKYKTTAIVANAATGCWMLGHWEKALFIIGKACSDDPTDADNLNNYASFLIMTGGEQAAIPILEYLNSKYLNNSTILNNLGQAWFGLGDTEKAKKYLDAATELCPNHSMANSTLAKIFSGGSGSESNKTKAISYLKASLKASYDPEKEADLAKLGYKTTYDDLPPFNYPMQDDPFNLVQLIKLIPRKLQTDLDDPEPAYTGLSFINGVEEFYRELNEEDVVLEKQVKDRAIKLTGDIPYQQEFIEAHNCPAHLLAARSLILLNAENFHSGSPLITQLLMPYTKIAGGTEDYPLAPEDVIHGCIQMWNKEVKEPITQLSSVLEEDLAKARGDCKAIDAIYVAYMNMRSKIYYDGVTHIQNEYISKSERMRAWILLNLYALQDDPPKEILDFTRAFLDHLPELIAKDSYQNKVYENALQFMELGKEYFNIYTSACKNKNDPDQFGPAEYIKKYRVKKIPCNYQKVFSTPIDYVFALKCNTKIEETSSKLKKRKSNVDKGEVESSKPPKLKDILGPIMQAIRKGPINFPDETEEAQSSDQAGPLTSEDKELSQFSLEYNRSGNLVGLNFQLSEDGTTLKDPGSVESGVDTRWCWNARASAKKGYMNKLLMTQK